MVTIIAAEPRIGGWNAIRMARKLFFIFPTAYRDATNSRLVGDVETESGKDLH